MAIVRSMCWRHDHDSRPGPVGNRQASGRLVGHIGHRMCYKTAFPETTRLCMTTPTILVIYAHPAPHRSPVHRRLAEAARALPGVEVRDLYELYPDFDIDGDHERALLAAAHLLVFLHPFRWYGMPSLVKEWMEVVLLPGWAYNDGNHAGECAL